MGGVADNTLDCVAYQYRRTNSRLFLLSRSLGGFLQKYTKKYEKPQSFASYANGFQAVPRLGLERISCLMEILEHAI